MLIGRLVVLAQGVTQNSRCKRFAVSRNRSQDAALDHLLALEGGARRKGMELSNRSKHQVGMLATSPTQPVLRQERVGAFLRLKFHVSSSYPSISTIYTLC